MDTKRCTKCGQPKPVEGFYRKGSAKDGRSSWCKKCEDASTKQYVSTPEGRERKREADRRYYMNRKRKDVPKP